MPPTLVSQRQLNTRELFSVSQILLSRGFEVIKIDNEEKLLIIEENIYDEIWKSLYEIYRDPNLRGELRFCLNNNKEAKSEKIIELYKHPKFIKKYNRFDSTFEWFIGELMIREFAAFSASHGVIVRNIQRNSKGTDSGDFDSLVVLRDTNLAYFECKAGDFDKDSILKCYERMLSLNCQYSIFICNLKIDEEKLRWETQNMQIPIVNKHFLNKINIKGKEHDSIYELNNCYILDIMGNIEDKIRTALRINAAKMNSIHNTISPDNKKLEDLGYDVVTISSSQNQA